MRMRVRSLTLCYLNVFVNVCVMRLRKGLYMQFVTEHISQDDVNTASNHFRICVALREEVLHTYFDALQYFWICSVDARDGNVYVHERVLSSLRKMQPRKDVQEVFYCMSVRDSGSNSLHLHSAFGHDLFAEVRVLWSATTFPQHFRESMAEMNVDKPQKEQSTVSAEDACLHSKMFRNIIFYISV